VAPERPGIGKLGAFVLRGARHQTRHFILVPEKLAELAVFIRERDEAAWDRQIDRDFTEDGGLHRVAEERFARTFARVACRICRDRQNAPDIWKHFDELL
jgi:hypothetical protein